LERKLTVREKRVVAQAVEAIDSKVKSHQWVEMAEDTGTLVERVELKRDGV
jgi:hypothetical protein